MKKKFENNIAKNGNKRPFNLYIKSKTKSRDNVGPLKVGNVYITDNDKMATILNSTFSAVCSYEDLSNVPVCQVRPSPITQPSLTYDSHPKMSLRK